MKKFVWMLFLLFPICAAAVQNYMAIDMHAQNSPPLKTNNGLPKLVQYLVAPYRSDIDKARVLLAWIVYNVSYDEYKAKHERTMDAELEFAVERNPKTGKLALKRGEVKFNQVQDTLQQTLKTRKGICKDIARLYQHMGRLAGLEMELVTGYACQNVKGDAHMWVAIKVSGVWYFVDPTWALKGYRVVVRDEQEAKRVQKKLERGADVTKMKNVSKAVADEWFMVDNDEIIKTHYPFERRWQLQKGHVEFEDFLQNSCHLSFEEFLKQMDAK